MGVKGRRVALIEELSNTVISFQKVDPKCQNRQLTIIAEAQNAIECAKSLIADTIERNISPNRKPVKNEVNDIANPTGDKKNKTLIDCNEGQYKIIRDNDGYLKIASNDPSLLNGYVYVRNAFSQDKQTKYWICELNERKGRENSCMGRAVTSMRHESEDFDVTVTQNHSHAPGIELQRSPSTESIKSDRTEPGNVPDTSAFADEIFDKEQQNDKIINEIMEKLNNETNMDQTINEEKMVKYYLIKIVN
uniref:FLYWCH-type domain-containing protein n=1 Tax=Meloidogyne hapla TaxID=6305 RepID=A0A1I8BCY9_MELHA